MKPFNWEIGEVPEGWESADSVRVINGDFRGGPRACAEPVFDSYGWDLAYNPATLCYYTFFEEQWHKVRAWVDWFMTEYER